MQRSAGILLPVSSLPSPYGIGCFSQEAYDFVDWLKDAGQTYWQILPLGVTSYGDSPYQSFSAFAGNPYFISLDELVKEGVLTAEECKKAKFGRKADDIDYSQLYKERGRLLRLAYSRSDIGHNVEFAAFCEQNKWWLDDFALFMAVKDRFEGKPWIEWAEDIRLRWQNAMDYYRRELYFEVEYYKYLQFKFDQQWRALKAYANEKGIRIIGDIPIYVALDSADAWANPQMFQLDEDNIPTAVAGVPPDGFSPTGQLWGNPLYRWEKHRETGYQWWITRLWYCFELYDVVRIDHFRGFDEYFSIPYGSETAALGHWEKGPGIELFRAVEQALGKREIIAEDLGYMSETVRQLVRDSGFPGMKVLEFAFDSRDTGSASDYLPHNYPVNSVAYTGTHDNETLASWYQTITSAERALVRDYLCDYATPEAQLYKSMIALIFRSAAALNMDAVLVTPSCCDPLCRRAVRVSMGTVFQVPWTQIGSTAADWPEQGMQQLHALGFKTAAMALTDLSVSIDDAALAAEPKLAIVLGTEGDGLAHTTIAACDYTVRIPMSHGVDSLNVAAASAVAFWQLGKQ